jgi:hypothetical protein
VTLHVQSLKDIFETKKILKYEPKLPGCGGRSDAVVVLLGVGGGVMVLVSVRVPSDDSDEVHSSVHVA